jgi:hypothetical protein
VVEDFQLGTFIGMLQYLKEGYAVMLGDVPQTETVQWFVSQLLRAGLKHTVFASYNQGESGRNSGFDPHIELIASEAVMLVSLEHACCMSCSFC